MRNVKKTQEIEITITDPNPDNLANLAIRFRELEESGKVEAIREELKKESPELFGAPSLDHNS